MTFKMPIFSKGEDIFKLNPVLRNIEAFKDLDNEEMCFVALMCDAMSPFRFIQVEQEKINAIIETIPSVRAGLKQSHKKRFLGYKKAYSKAVLAYRKQFSSGGDERALKARDALIHTFNQFCDLYGKVNLLKDKEGGDLDLVKIDKDTLDNIKQITTMVKAGTIPDLDKQIQDIENRLAFIPDIKEDKGASTDPMDIISEL
jgi:hypothetical protein